MKIYVNRFDGRNGIDNPKYPGDAGYDLYPDSYIVIPAHETRMIYTGVYVEIPERHVGLIKDRSSLALSDNLHILGGVIDSSYRGEIQILMHNLGDRPVMLNEDQRVAQLVIVGCCTEPIELVSQDEFAAMLTERNANSFGSTGK